MDYYWLLCIGCGAQVIWFGLYTRRYFKYLDRKADEARAEAIAAREALRQARAAAEAARGDYEQVKAAYARKGA